MNYRDFFNNNAGKKVRVIMTDSAEFEGVLFAYFSAYDNEPDPESIVVDRIELPISEIKKIVLIN